MQSKAPNNSYNFTDLYTFITKDLGLDKSDGDISGLIHDTTLPLIPILKELCDKDDSESLNSSLNFLENLTGAVESMSLSSSVFLSRYAFFDSKTITDDKAKKMLEEFKDKGIKKFNEIEKDFQEFKNQEGKNNDVCQVSKKLLQEFAKNAAQILNASKLPEANIIEYAVNLNNAHKAVLEDIEKIRSLLEIRQIFNEIIEIKKKSENDIRAFSLGILESPRYLTDPISSPYPLFSHPFEVFSIVSRAVRNQRILDLQAKYPDEDDFLEQVNLITKNYSELFASHEFFLQNDGHFIQYLKFCYSTKDALKSREEEKNEGHMMYICTHTAKIMKECRIFRSTFKRYLEEKLDKESLTDIFINELDQEKHEFNQEKQQASWINIVKPKNDYKNVDRLSEERKQSSKER